MLNTPFPPRLKAVVFDLDGTLLDTATEFVEVVQRLRAEHQLGPLDEDSIRRQVSNGARALVSLSLELTPEHPDFENKRLRLLDLYSEVLGSSTRPYPGIEDLLLRLDQQGIAWGISTNKPSLYTLPLLDRIALQSSPASVICADQVGHPKPHPESLLLACHQLACKPAQVVYVGDHLRDIQAGRRAGMHTIAAAYGYIEEADNPADWGAASVALTSQSLGEHIARAYSNDHSAPGDANGHQLG